LLPWLAAAAAAVVALGGDAQASQQQAMAVWQQRLLPHLLPLLRPNLHLSVVQERILSFVRVRVRVSVGAGVRFRVRIRVGVRVPSCC
jgi:hypothetical protein